MLYGELYVLAFDSQYLLVGMAVRGFLHNLQLMHNINLDHAWQLPWGKQLSAVKVYGMTDGYTL